MSSRPRTEQVCISVERKHAEFSTSGGTCVYQAKGANGTRDIHFPHEKNSWTSAILSILFKDRDTSEGGLLHTEGQLGVGDGFDQIHFLPELIDLSCGLAKTHWGRQGQRRDSVGRLWLVRAK